MNKLKVGDRVKIYEGHSVFKATIVGIFDSRIRSREDDDGSERMYHYKQCRKLVKKKKKFPNVWINFYTSGSIYVHASLEESNNHININRLHGRAIRYKACKDEK